MSASKTAYKYNASILPKSTEIKIITHEEILAIGNRVHKSTEASHNRIFETRLSKEVEQLIKKLRNEHEKEYGKLRKQHQVEIERMRKEYVKKQEDALRREALRVKAILNNETKILIENTEHNGQKKLEEALVKARHDFEREKEKEIVATIEEQTRLTKMKLDELHTQHEKDMEELNTEWERKLQLEISKADQNLQEKLESERKKLAEQFENQMNVQLSKALEKHAEEVRQHERMIDEKSKQILDLKLEIEQLKSKVNEKILCIEKVIDSFRNFIENSPGFYSGQSDFVLKDLISMNDHDRK